MSRRDSKEPLKSVFKPSSADKPTEEEMANLSRQFDHHFREPHVSGGERFPSISEVGRTQSSEWRDFENYWEAKGPRPRDESEPELEAEEADEDEDEDEDKKRREKKPTFQELHRADAISRYIRNNQKDTGSTHSSFQPVPRSVEFAFAKKPFEGYFRSDGYLSDNVYKFSTGLYYFARDYDRETLFAFELIKLLIKTRATFDTLAVWSQWCQDFTEATKRFHSHQNPSSSSAKSEYERDRGQFSTLRTQGEQWLRALWDEGGEWPHEQVKTEYKAWKKNRTESLAWRGPIKKGYLQDDPRQIQPK
ncbi:hypothetical protein T439DRAFT_247720 [Meredithblackwellia eburnea MCA 4105]